MIAAEACQFVDCHLIHIPCCPMPTLQHLFAKGRTNLGPCAAAVDRHPHRSTPKPPQSDGTSSAWDFQRWTRWPTASDVWQPKLLYIGMIYVQCYCVVDRIILQYVLTVYSRGSTSKAENTQYHCPLLRAKVGVYPFNCAPAHGTQAYAKWQHHPTNCLLIPSTKQQLTIWPFGIKQIIWRTITINIMIIGSWIFVRLKQWILVHLFRGSCVLRYRGHLNLSRTLQ